MSDNDELISEFYEDTQAHLENIEADVLKLEQDHDQSDIIDAVFRMVHSIKGNSGMLGIDSIRKNSEVFENFLDEVRERKTATSKEIDTMFNHLDSLKKVVNHERGGEPEIQAEESSASAEPIAAPQEGAIASNNPNGPVNASNEAVQNEKPAPPMPARQSETDKTADDDDNQPAIEAPLAATYLTFKLEDEHYGIDIMQVREIILKEEITPVPNTNSFVLGVMNLRDQIIPVFNLKEKLNVEDYDKTIDEKNIIVIDIHKNTTGLRVDEVTGIITLTDDKISPAADFLGTIPTEFLHGMGQTDDDTIILLNVKDLCDPDETLF